MRSAFRRDAERRRGERNRRSIERRIDAAASKGRRPVAMPDGYGLTAGAGIPENRGLLAATRTAIPNARLHYPLARAGTHGGGIPRR